MPVSSKTDGRLYPTLATIPLFTALIAVGLIGFGSWTVVSIVLLGFWGLFATAAPVGWWTWLAKALPNDTEAGGGLMVAVVQLAITLGATLGGLLFDFSGYQAAFALAAALLVGSAVASVAAARVSVR